MSREHNLYSNLLTVEAGNRESLLETLKSLSDFDCDFNGDNGTDYAWEETLEAGFESNLEYMLNEVKDIENDVDCVELFVNAWMETDMDYYSAYQLDYLTDSNGNIIVINLAVMTGY